MKTRLYSACMIAFCAAAILTGCTKDEDNPIIDSPDTEVQSSLQFVVDTLYATPEDSVVFLSIASGNATMLSQYIDAGDGNQRHVIPASEDTAATVRLYTQKGTYTAILSAEQNGTPVYADTAVVIVQDYVRPSKATRAVISIDNARLCILHRDWTSYPLPEKDSSYITYFDGYTLYVLFRTIGNAYMAAPWNNMQHLHYNRRIYESQYEEVYRYYQAYIRLSADGSVIEYMEIRTGYIANMSLSSEDEARIIKLENVPLNTTETNSSSHAVYTTTRYSFDHAMDFQYWDKLTIERHGQTSEFLYFTENLDMTVTVTFKE